MRSLEPRHFEDVHKGDDLPTRINKLHRIAQDYGRSAIETAQAVGDLLLEAKKKVGHGEWLNWLSDHVAFGERTARNYMRVARSLPKLEDEDRQRVADLSFRDLLGTLVSDSNKLAKLPDPEGALQIAENVPVRRAVTRASTAERVRCEQVRPVAPHEQKAGATVVIADAPVFRVPAWHVELRDKVLELARQAMVAHRLEATDVLEALNDAYCLIQDGEESP